MMRKLSSAHNGAGITARDIQTRNQVDREVRVYVTPAGVVALVTGSILIFIAPSPT